MFQTGTCENSWKAWLDETIKGCSCNRTQNYKYVFVNYEEEHCLDQLRMWWDFSHVFLRSEMAFFYLSGFSLHTHIELWFSIKSFETVTSDHRFNCVNFHLVLLENNPLVLTFDDLLTMNLSASVKEFYLLLYSNEPLSPFISMLKVCVSNPNSPIDSENNAWFFATWESIM